MPNLSFRRVLPVGVAVGLALAAAYPLVVGWQVGDALSAPAPFAKPDAPGRYGLAYEHVAIQSPRVAKPLDGWLFKNPQAGDRAVLFLHGWRSHKQHMLKNYLSWLARRYTVLAFDHPGHGQSPAGPVTLGFREREDAAAALAFLRERGYKRTAVFGTSMGGTTAIDMAAADTGVRAVVSEGTFAQPSVVPLSYLRSKGFVWPEAVAFVSLLRLSWLAGHDVGEAGAERWIGAIAPRPVLLIHGTADHVIPSENAGRLFAAAREPKSLWLVPGADHMSEDATGPHAVAPAEYERRVTSFLDQAL